MDTEAVNSSGNLTIPPSKKQSDSLNPRSEAVSASEPKVSSDKVDLSSKAQALVQDKNGVQGSSNNEQRKFSVTDDNDVVLQVIDPKTHKVVKSIPTEEQIQLKNAVRDGINDILE